MRKSISFSILIFGFICSLLGQEKDIIPMQIRGIMVGGNFSKIHFDKKRQQSAFSFSSVGINTEFHLKNKLYLGSTFFITNQKSNITPSIQVKQQVAQLLIGPSIKIDDIKFIAGFSLEYRTALTLRSITESPINLTSSVGETVTQFNLMLGTEFYLSPKFSMYLNGIVPTQSTNSSSFQIGLKYRFHAKIEKVESYREHSKAMAKKDIVLLKGGALLVRLKTSENKIVALRKADREKQALKAVEWQKAQNQKIVKAFKTYFDFAPIYFFYSEHSDNVRQGKYKGIFLNENLELDSTIVLDNRPVYTAEYTAIKQDTFVQFSHNELEQTGNFQSEWVPRYYGQPNMGFRAIVVKNQNFEQMVEPFPYYARTNAPGIQKHPEQLLFGFPLIYFMLNSSYSAAVEALNGKLHRFYKRSQ